MRGRFQVYNHEAQASESIRATHSLALRDCIFWNVFGQLAENPASKSLKQIQR